MLKGVKKNKTKVKLLPSQEFIIYNNFSHIETVVIIIHYKASCVGHWQKIQMYADFKLDLYFIHRL